MAENQSGSGRGPGAVAGGVGRRPRGGLGAALGRVVVVGCLALAGCETDPGGGSGSPGPGPGLGGGGTPGSNRVVRVGDPQGTTQFSVIASAPVTVHVYTVRAGSPTPDRTYFAGEMTAGDELVVQKRGAVSVFYSKGANLNIVVGGRRFPMSKPALGVDIIP